MIGENAAENSAQKTPPGGHGEQKSESRLAAERVGKAGSEHRQDSAGELYDSDESDHAAGKDERRTEKRPFAVRQGGSRLYFAVEHALESA